MKLLYLYIEDYGCFHQQEFNFDSNIRFHFNQDNENPILEYEKKDVLPQKFFSLNGTESSPVECISAIVGKNGSGKTTLAKIIDTLFHTPDEQIEYIIVFSIEEKFKCQYHFKEKQIEYNNIGIEPIKLLETHNEKERENFKRFVYYSPFFTTENNQITKEDDISVSKYLREINKGDRLDNYMEGYMEDYKEGEYKRITSFLEKYNNNNNNNKLSIPIPLGLKLYPKHELIGKAYTHVKEICEQYSKKDFLSNETLDLYKTILDILAYKALSFDICVLLSFFSSLCLKNVQKNIFINISQDFLKTYSLFLSDRIHSNNSNPLYHELSEKTKTIENSYDKKINTQIIKLLEHYHKKPNYSKSPYCDVNLTKKDQIIWLYEFIKLYFDSELSKYDFISFAFVPEMSSGETAFLSLFSKLYDFFKSYNIDIISMPDSCEYFPEILLFLDEAETVLHPEWQRNLVRLIIQIFEVFFSKLRIHILFASHSPILLSDIPQNNVIFLKSEKKYDEIVKNESIKRGDKYENTFGSNIFDLYKDAFFLENGTVGCFAQGKIDELLKKVNEKKDFSDDDLMTTMQIGDPVIRNYILNRIKTPPDSVKNKLITYYENKIKELNGGI